MNRIEQSKEALDALRKRVDNIDNALVFLLAERFCVTQDIGKMKKKQNWSAVDNLREQEQFVRIKRLAEDAGLSPEFAERFLRLIIEEVVLNHNRL